MTMTHVWMVIAFIAGWRIGKRSGFKSGIKYVEFSMPDTLFSTAHDVLLCSPIHVVLALLTSDPHLELKLRFLNLLGNRLVFDRDMNKVKWDQNKEVLEGSIKKSYIVNPREDDD